MVFNRCSYCDERTSCADWLVGAAFYSSGTNVCNGDQFGTCVCDTGYKVGFHWSESSNVNLLLSYLMANVFWKLHVRQTQKIFPIGPLGEVVLSLVEAASRHVLDSVSVTLVMVTLLRHYVIVGMMIARFWHSSHAQI